jgi:small-conductance mechanosensitive channel
MEQIWDYVFWGNTVRDWTIAAGIILLSMLALRILRTIVLKRLNNWAQKTSNTFDDFVIRVFKRSVMPMLYIAAIFAGLQYLVIPAKISRVMHVALMVVIVFFVIRIITDIISYAFDRFTGGENEAQARQARGILLIVKVILWLIGIVFLVDNLGYDITTIVAGLGIGGIAIALAAQTILGDLFSYLVIFFDKPFQTGDFISIGSQSGVVDYVGIKTTRIRTLSGEQLVVSNTDLTNSRVQNFKKMERRRVVFSIGVLYETGSDKLKRIPDMIRNIIEPMEEVTFDRAHFMAFGDFSLNFEIVYYVESADYVLYMDRHQQICLEIYEQFEAAGIEFAYPTQKLFVVGNDRPEEDMEKQEKS